MRLDRLYATGAREVPAGAPAGLVPTKWPGYLVAAEQAGDVAAYRRYWELAMLVGKPGEVRLTDDGELSRWVSTLPMQ
ncbi:hypothetical protein [Micromonospora zamorensis]|uniref:hypothetical protein n=1 Tax=Micromonospora zamorensis TaxID=709883 RepID=UPI003CF722A4